MWLLRRTTRRNLKGRTRKVSNLKMVTIMNKFNEKLSPEILRAHGVKPSFQRMKIYNYIMKNRNHPVVDTIYNALVSEIPTLSKTTVYNTLNIFKEKNLVQAVTIEDNELRYDGNITKHGHFKCTKCNCITDFEINLDKLNTAKSLDKYKIQTYNINYTGVCNKCQKN